MRCRFANSTWERYGSLKDAIGNNVLTVRGTGRFDSIRIERVNRADSTEYRVRFNGNALFGADAADVRAGAGRMDALVVLRDFVHSDPRLNRAAIQRVYWVMDRQGKADAESMRELVAKLKNLKRPRNIRAR